MAKVFISFLGAIPYQPSRYYSKTDRRDLSEPMYYVQEAILRGNSWNKEDKVWIFTTEDAYRNNYLNRIERSKGNEFTFQSDGLEHRLKILSENGTIFHFDNVPIPNGYTADQMWTIFSSIFSKLRQSDNLYMDVTYGFRSLPMLATILVNYARTLKQVKVKAIYYGAFEAGRQEKADYQLTEIEAPIIDLNVFTELQDWTYAAQTFLQAGNPSLLAELTNSKQKDFANSILDFSQSILTCRGFDLLYRKDLDRLNQMIDELEQTSNIQAQLKPLLEKVKEKVSPFKTNTVENGFGAVQWCIDHGMVQQGITFLQETLISLIIEEVLGKEYINNQIYRFAANGTLNKIKNPSRTIQMNKKSATIPIEEEKIKSNYTKMLNYVNSKPNLSRLYKKLTGAKGIRNDINHCGFRENPENPIELGKSLKHLFEEIKIVLREKSIISFCFISSKWVYYIIYP